MPKLNLGVPGHPGTHPSYATGCPSDTTVIKLFVLERNTNNTNTSTLLTSLVTKETHSYFAIWRHSILQEAEKLNGEEGDKVHIITQTKIKN